MNDLSKCTPASEKQNITSNCLIYRTQLKSDCGDILATRTSNQASAPRHAALVVLKGQRRSLDLALPQWFSATNVVDQWHAHGQRAGPADSARLEHADHSPSMRHQWSIKGCCCSTKWSKPSFVKKPVSLLFSCANRHPQRRLPAHRGHRLPRMPPKRFSHPACTTNRRAPHLHATHLTPPTFTKV